jgi:glycosyltransferase involved in cell wall biosynthesis
MKNEAPSALHRTESVPHPGRDLPLSLIVFAFNEALNVPSVLPEILDYLRARTGPWQLVFVDDGSTDETAERVKEVFAGDERCTIVRHDRNCGIGAALKSGRQAATQPWMTFLPCDGQIPVSELDKLCDEAVRADVEVVFSVYPHRDDGLHRTILSAGVRALIYAVHGVRMRSDGPYLTRTSLFRPEVLEPDTFFLNFEFPIRVMRDRVRFSTVEVLCVPRRAGHSKSTGWKRIAGVARDLVNLKLRLLRAR